MNATKAFPTVNVLSLVIDRVLIEQSIEIELEILSWMTGQDVYIHQYPRLSREVVPHILGMHVELEEVVNEAALITVGNCESWRDRWLTRYGPEIALRQLPETAFERIDPRSELSEKKHPDQVFTISDGTGT